MKESKTWKSVKDVLPSKDREVIVLSKYGRISFGHIVNPKTAVSYDGWNVQDVAYWRPCDFTKEMIESLNEAVMCTPENMK